MRRREEREIEARRGGNGGQEGKREKPQKYRELECVHVCVRTCIYVRVQKHGN